MCHGAVMCVSGYGKWRCLQKGCGNGKMSELCGSTAGQVPLLLHNLQAISGQLSSNSCNCSLGNRNWESSAIHRIRGFRKGLMITSM